VTPAQPALDPSPAARALPSCVLTIGCIAAKREDREEGTSPLADDVGDCDGVTMGRRMHNVTTGVTRRPPRGVGRIPDA
jgi:hypothetical protein